MDRPNVLIVMTDDQGYGDMSCHGNPVLKTPHLDRLHEQSIRFTDFHSAPVCTPSRGQLLTGMDAMRNGAWAWAFGHEMIRRDVVTMPQVFKKNGYRTGHFGKWHLGDNYPYRPKEKGFDESITHGGAATHQTPDYWQNDNFDDFYRHNDGSFQQHKGYCTDVWFDLSMDFMKRCQKAGTPFFCYLPTNAPHTPYYVEKKYSKPFLAAGMDEEVAKYLGMVVNLDENMGRLNAFLDANDLADNTIVIFMTDNGGTTGTKVFTAGMRGRKQQYYEGGHRVPCFIRWPRGAFGSPRDAEDPAQMQDLLPTLIDLCDLKVGNAARQQFDGISLADLLCGETEHLSDRKLVVQWSKLDFPAYGDAAVIWKEWRLVHDRELYNIASDPGQQNDVASQHPEIVETLKAHYADWWKGVEPLVADYGRPILGGAENPVRLTCFEWRKKTTKANVTVQYSVWDGLKANGEWMLEVETPGKYRIELRRYPLEANAAICAAYPARQREFVHFNECKALPILSARLRIGDFDQTLAVKPTDKAVPFEVNLPAGEIPLKTWFMDETGEELCGAYYVDVTKR
ncbi:arylsulfatase [Pontiella sulfatireligans]|nr:arylsulfatase [Pontiella sulfatireligans]